MKLFPVLGRDSVRAAVAAQCAAQQDSFWEYHDLLYAGQPARAGFSWGTLQSYAARLGLDGPSFAACLESPEALAAVQADFDEGARLGLRGVPATLVNGQLLDGLRPLDHYRSAIEVELAK